MLPTHINKRVRHLSALGLALLMVLFTVQALAGSAVPIRNVSTTSAKSDPMAENWGLRVTSIRMSANDHMIDFRYRVLDAKKADTLFAGDAKPYLVHAETGMVLAVPRTAKVGPLMSTYQHKQDRIYWMFFGNHSKLVKAGDKVSVVIGEFRADNLLVQ